MINFQKILVLIGPPGVGKSYYAQWLRENYFFSYLSSGDVARQLGEKTHQAGNEQIYQLIKEGKLLPAKLISQLTFQAMEASQSPFFILDGFPRNTRQLNYFLSTVTENQIFFLSLISAPQFCAARVKNRQVCTQCHAIYNRQTNPSQKNNLCDRDQGKLITRIDDQQFQQRFTVFSEETLPMLAHLKKTAPQLLFAINVDNQTSEELKNQLRKICQKEKILAKK